MGIKTQKRLNKNSTEDILTSYSHSVLTDREERKKDIHFEYCTCNIHKTWIFPFERTCWLKIARNITLELKSVHKSTKVQIMSFGTRRGALSH